MVITEEFFAAILKLFARGFFYVDFFTWIYSVLLSVAIVMAES